MNDHEIFERLQELGAGEFAHFNGTFLSHLRGTHDLLVLWGASEALCRAGLYHAVYGTADYHGTLLTLDGRQQIQELIGTAAEEIVYLYCACDRAFVCPQIGLAEQPIYRDRFSGEKYALAGDALKTFCELTVANELEIARGSSAFVRQYGAGLRQLFVRMKPYLSRPAYDSFLEILSGETNAQPCAQPGPRKKAAQTG